MERRIHTGSHIFVVAIDLGTAYSSYAFSSRLESEKISGFNWGQSNKLLSLKTQTSILFDADKKFHSFGIAAEQMYSDLASDGIHKDWYFFRQFKMCLFDRITLQKDFCIEDETGNSLPAIEVFSSSIKFLKDHFLKNMQRSCSDVTDSDVLWVLTVPAIWNEAAKKFMLEAAKKAGIPGDKVLLALEPVAASLYCRSIMTDEKSPFQPGAKYLLVDAGGGTVDIAVYEVKPNKSVIELHRPSGGDWGGTYVNKAFLQLLDNICGEGTIEQCKQEDIMSVLDLLRDFEIKKRNFEPGKKGLVTILLPSTLQEKLENGMRVRVWLPSTKCTATVHRFRDKLRIEPSVIKDMFAGVMNPILGHLKKLFKEEHVRDVSTILMVGDFSESPMLQRSIENTFPSKRVVKPDESGLAVLKGAVLFGQNPAVIKGTTNKPHFIVAAIDLGTSYSGYAFSTKDNFLKDPTIISTSKWNADTGGLISLKQLTCVLFDHKKNFHSFGFEAEQKYADLALEKEHSEWYFFKDFKMELYNKQSLQKDAQIKDICGKELPAKDVFSASIGYLKAEVMKKCRSQFTGTNDFDVRWVITVPAIWSESAKKFMREAAVNACIPGNNLTLALEPEAAAVFCKNIPTSSTGIYGNSSFLQGSKYLVLDAGGGTVDVAVHEVLAHGKIRELFRASGGDWGGSEVDKQYMKLLTDIVNEEVMSKYTSNVENTLDILDIFRDFEVKKRNFNPYKNSNITCRIPSSLNYTLESVTRKRLMDILPLTKYKNTLKCVGDKLRIDRSLTNTMFEPVVDRIINHLKNVFTDDACRSVTSMVMVGGFSESDMLQACIRETFPDKTVIVPDEAGLAVLKGAVMFGHDQSIISERKCRYTYGFKYNKLLSEMADKDSSIPKDLKVTDNEGQTRVLNAFDKHVTKGQHLKTGEAQDSRTYQSMDGLTVTLEMYASTDVDPIIVTDSSCTPIGKLHIDVEGLKDTRVNVSITFSDTELSVDVTKCVNGEAINAAFELLN